MVKSKRNDYYAYIKWIEFYCEEWDRIIPVESKYEIIWNPATLSDLNRWFLENRFWYWNNPDCLDIHKGSKITIDYNGRKDLLDQSEETLKKIIELIKNNS